MNAEPKLPESAAPLARLLIVDDEEAQLRALCDTLRLEGFAPTGFASPREALARLQPDDFETFNAVLKVAPALAAGNCVVLKPSELASRSALRLAGLAVNAGLPAGVLNVVLGTGEVVGEALGVHLDVDMIAFTGSPVVGRFSHSRRAYWKRIAGRRAPGTSCRSDPLVRS